MNEKTFVGPEPSLGSYKFVHAKYEQQIFFRISTFAGVAEETVVPWTEIRKLIRATVKEIVYRVVDN